ncbi:MAG: Uma2 family endonuclease [Bacteroidota bacterium]
MGEKVLPNYSYEAYLALEVESEVKYEYHDGMIVAMAGGTLEHGVIISNFMRVLPEMENCTILPSEVKVHIEASNRTFYPDVSIVCGEFEKSEKDKHAITNPLLIVEVLSEGTAAFDRGEKFAHYREIPVLKEYVLVSQSAPLVDTYFRTENGTWEIETIRSLTESVYLKSIDCEIPMDKIYRKISGIA